LAFYGCEIAPKRDPSGERYYVFEYKCESVFGNRVEFRAKLDPGKFAILIVKSIRCTISWKRLNVRAYLQPDSNFNTETAAHERNGNDHCSDDQEKWFAWLDRAGALHLCDWGDDEDSFIDAICAAVRANAPILVLELLG
jgi:hypothetical protein